MHPDRRKFHKAKERPAYTYYARLSAKENVRKKTKMKIKLSSTIIIFGLMLSIVLISTTTATTIHAQISGLSIDTIEPEAAATLKAQGRDFKYPFPNDVNNGKKFNPVGNTIPPLTTAQTQKILVIFVEFTTLPPGGPDTRLDLGYFDSMLFGTVYDPPEYQSWYPGPPAAPYPTDRTLYNYFKEVSYGYIDIITLNMPSTQGWANSGHSYDYYCRADGIHDNGFGPYPENAQGLVIDAIKAVDPIINFSPYAVNGEVPNLFVVHAGTGAEWSADPSIIWSHSWDVSDATGLDGYMADGVKLNNYAMMPEVGGDLTNYLGGGAYGPYPPTVGVYAHEYGHVLGLPDQYDYGYESEGTGYYSLMAGGSWNRYPYTAMPGWSKGTRIFAGNSPAHMDAWSKYRLGFLTPTEITSFTSVIMPPAETDAVAYKMVVPYSGGKEYFLLENRQSIGFDQGLLQYGAHGLAIYHVDDTVFTRNYGRPNEAENWKEFRSEGWKKAWTGETHYAISLIQADDQWHLEHGTNGADPGDLYPGIYGVTSISSYTTLNTSNYYFWGGSKPKFGYSGVTIENIQETGTTISAELSFKPWTPLKT